MNNRTMKEYLERVISFASGGDPDKRRTLEQIAIGYKHNWECEDNPGEYDSLYECAHCHKRVMVSIDDPASYLYNYNEEICPERRDVYSLFIENNGNASNE